MKKKDLIIAFMPLVILVILSVIGLALIAASPFIAKELEKKNEVVEQYENGLDELDIEYDDDNYQYIVYTGNKDKGTLKQYIVKLEDVVVIPYTENEVHFEITKGGKCKLYFFVKWEVEE